tara:strand:+ start:1308 stop:1760 length:453 start_codon:yes stop_codon:yes gene_type:complete
MNIINNVLTNKERKDLIKSCQPYLKDWGPNYPGTQTENTIFTHFKFKDIHYKILSKIKPTLSLKIKSSWINQTQGKKKDTQWHTHSCDYTLIYYMQTLPFFNSGTLFKDKFIRVKQNSLLLFPGNIEHATPSYPFPFFNRYSLVMELTNA